MSDVRPNGAWQTSAGKWLFALAMLSAIGAVFLPQPGSSNRLSDDDLALRAFLSMIAGASFASAILLASVGSIIRAIWFLPGRPNNEVTSDDETCAD